MDDSDSHCRPPKALFGIIGTFLSRPLCKHGLRAAATMAFVIFVNRSVNRAQVVHLIGEINFFTLLPAITLGAGSFFLQTLRWRTILQYHSLPCSMRIALKTMLKGSLLAFITPGRTGELFRAMDIDDTRRLSSMVAVIEERSFGIGMTVIGGIFCIAAQMIWYSSKPFLPVVIASCLFVTVLIVTFTFIFLGNWPQKGQLNRMRGYLRRLVQSFPVARIIMLSAAAHACLLVQTSLLLMMFGAGSFQTTLVAGGQAYAFMLLLPFFIANIGLREYSFSLFITNVTNAATASPFAPDIWRASLGSATFILIINIILPAALGLIWLYTGKKSCIKTTFPKTGQTINSTTNQQSGK